MSATSPTFADVVEVAITHAHVDLAGLLGAAIWHADRRRVELEDLVERLVQDLAVRDALPVTAVRLRYGLNPQALTTPDQRPRLDQEAPR